VPICAASLHLLLIYPRKSCKQPNVAAGLARDALSCCGKPRHSAVWPTRLTNISGQVILHISDAKFACCADQRCRAFDAGDVIQSVAIEKELS
jgi:hypothetical protein